MFVVMAALPWLAAAAAAGQKGADQLYTPAQAKQGLATYDRKCATCHDGGTMGPELWGDDFLKQWKDKELITLYTRMKDTMPEDNPGSLTEGEVLGVVAFVLQQNDVPAGGRPIETAAELKGVKLGTAR